MTDMKFTDIGDKEAFEKLSPKKKKQIERMKDIVQKGMAENIGTLEDLKRGIGDFFLSLDEKDQSMAIAESITVTLCMNLMVPIIDAMKRAGTDKKELIHMAKTLEKAFLELYDTMDVKKQEKEKTPSYIG